MSAGLMYRPSHVLILPTSGKYWGVTYCDRLSIREPPPASRRARLDGIGWDDSAKEGGGQQQQNEQEALEGERRRTGKNDERQTEGKSRWTRRDEEVGSSETSTRGSCRTEEDTSRCVARSMRHVRGAPA
ncbi:hypothetical protein I4F81_000768 [Pyropia yezoensis]|uniref:Uncharacterized protein n=1 Tax=Pyropia yezoensis TaxID=2788 RepID=A0ACC3BK20_PYRYE|nr:hypothetical protein I4F81_000768 [Neopyropia yezoensis]